VAPKPPSVIWKETPESHWGCALPSSRDPSQAAESGSGDPLPSGAWWPDLSGASKMLWEECQTTENKTLTQVVGGKGDLLC
jgi:hypothetical protein